MILYLLFTFDMIGICYALVKYWEAYMICYLTKLSDGTYIFLAEGFCVGGTKEFVSNYMDCLKIPKVDQARLFKAVDKPADESMLTVSAETLVGCA